MANSTTNLPTISVSQSSKEATANALFDAHSPSSLFGRNSVTTSALTWGYLGGCLNVAGTPTQIANGTVALTAASTNYVEATTAGVVSANTSAFTSGRLRLYTVVCGASSVTSYTDHRSSATGAGITGATGAGDALVANPLSQFAATTSAQLAGVISDETGSGALVFATSPTLVTPTLGVASATSVNKVALTAPATGSTLTIADGKTLTASNSLTLAGTDSTTMTFPPASASIGYINIPQNSQSTAYTTVMADQGKHILHPSADTTARTFTIDSNANVAYPIGTAITFVNQNGAGVMTIAITSDTMRLAGAGTTGSRTLAANGIATALKITSTEWIISGTGLT